MTTNLDTTPDFENPQPPLHVSIQYARLRLGLEPADVANWLGWSTDYYLTFETGENHPDSTKLDHIERALHKAAHYRTKAQIQLGKWHSSVLPVKGGVK